MHVTTRDVPKNSLIPSLSCCLKGLLCLSLLLLAFPVSSQNVFVRLGKNAKNLKIRRTITVAPIHADLAYNLAKRRSPDVTTAISRKVARITAEIKQPVLPPHKIAGGYNYLKMVGKTFKNQPQWLHANESGGYNGAHHIVTKTVISEIAKELDIQDVSTMQANAPAVYHFLHNHPGFGDLFHDHAMLLDLYHAKGVRGVVLDFFYRLNEINREMELPLYDEKFIQLELLEAELWAKHWGIKWE